MLSEHTLSDRERRECGGSSRVLGKQERAMNVMKTRREFLYDFGSLSFAILFNDLLVKKWLSPGNNLGCFKFDRKVCPEEQINVCYLGVGGTGMDIGEKLSAHVGANIQFAKLFEDGTWPSPCNDDSWRKILGPHLQKQDMIVLVGKVDDPVFSGLRQFVIPRTPYLWTIGIAPTPETDSHTLHHVPNEILRITRGPSFPYQDPENFIQSIFAVFLVQHQYIHNYDYNDICAEALDDLGL